MVSTPEGSNPDELPYVEMTRRMVETFPRRRVPGRARRVGASYFHAVNALYPDHTPVRVLACQPPKADGGTGRQIDAEYPRLTPKAAAAGGGGSAAGGAASRRRGARGGGAPTVIRATRRPTSATRS